MCFDDGLKSRIVSSTQVLYTVYIGSLLLHNEKETKGADV